MSRSKARCKMMKDGVSTRPFLCATKQVENEYMNESGCIEATETVVRQRTKIDQDAM